MSDHNDTILREWAQIYAKSYGTALLEEQAELQRQNLRYALPRADKRIKGLAKDRKKRSKIPYFAATLAAACLLLFIGFFAVLPLTNTSLLQDFQTATAPQAETESSQSLAAPSASAPSETSPPPSESTQNDSLSGENPSEPRALTFNLPARFSIASVKVDKRESIYELDDSLHDDVVLTIKDAPELKDWLSEMDFVLIDDKVIPAKIRDDYKLLRFEEDGSLYTISCKGDFKTLSVLYRSIVDPANKKA